MRVSSGARFVYVAEAGDYLYRVTLPLQLVGRQLAASLFEFTGIAARRDGTIVDFAGHQVGVAEACSGMRFLIPLAFVALVLAYLSDSKPWLRVALFCAALPIAVLGNALRIASAAYLPELTTGALHSASGVVTFMLCLASLVYLQRLLSAVHGHSRG